MQAMQARWFAVDCTTCLGEQRNVKLKAWTDADRIQSTWDAVALLDNIFPDQKLCVKLNSYFAHWVELWDALAIPKEERLIPSLRQIQKMRALPEEEQPFHLAWDANLSKVKAVPQFYTRAAVAALLHISDAGRSRVSESANMCMQAILNRFCSMEEFQAEINDIETAKLVVASYTCDQDLAADGLCEHVRNATNLTGIPRTAMFNADFVEVLVNLGHTATVCGRSASLLFRFVDLVGIAVDHYIAHLDEQDPTKHAFTRRKRWRDEDHRAYLMSGMVQDGRAQTAAAACRSDFGKAGTKMAHGWQVKEVAIQLAQTSIDFVFHSDPKTYSWTQDATRLGHPARDFQMHFLEKLNPNKSAWLLTQDVKTVQGRQYLRLFFV